MVALVCILAVIILIQRSVELHIANRNRSLALAAGAQEFGARHYPLFFLVHSAWFAGWIAEALLSGVVINSFWYVWLGLFLIAQILRYWCVISLGRCWNTRILVIPGAETVRRGPYRFFPHPNYLAVTIELISIPLIFGAIITAVFIGLLNSALLILIRIPEERRALQLLK